jgi:hypothetical protein
MFALFRLPKFFPLVNSRIEPENFGSLQRTAKMVMGVFRPAPTISSLESGVDAIDAKH